MDRAEPVDAAVEVMDVERVVRDDGRLLLLFTWPGAGESGAGQSVLANGPE